MKDYENIIYNYYNGNLTDMQEYINQNPYTFVKALKEDAYMSVETKFDLLYKYIIKGAK